MPQVILESLTQVPPTTATTATVQVSYELIGDPPDNVQIYAENAAATNPAHLVDQSDVDPNNIGEILNTDVQLVAGAYYTIFVCPRTETGGVLDDMIDGQYWESYCQSGYIVTVASAGPPGATPRPTIKNLVPQPATVSHGNQIGVTWSSTAPVYKIQITWTENGIVMPQHEDDFSDQGSSSGTWTAPTNPGDLYTFAANGGYDLGGDTWSGWGPSAKIIASQNVTSLRKFLELSGIDADRAHLRQLLAPGNSLRAYMKL